MRNKKTLAAFFMLLFTISSYAQDCKFDIVEKNKFTGTTLVGYFYSIDGNLIYLKKLDSVYTVELSTKSFSGSLKDVIEKGSVANFRLADNKIINLTSKEAVSPITKVGSSQVYSIYRVVYQISLSDVESMSKSALVGMRFQLGAIIIESDISQKKGEKIMHASKCLVSHQ